MPWLYFIFYRLKILELFGIFMESIFSFEINDQENTARDKNNKWFFLIFIIKLLYSMVIAFSDDANK